MTIHQSGDAFDLLTLTRASGGMRTNRNALLEWMGNNVPREDYDPITLAPRGLLLEGGRTNLLQRSQELDNAYWTKSRSTITADVAVAPDGTATADKLVEDTTPANTHLISRLSTASASTAYTWSFFVKAGEITEVAFQMWSNTGSNPGSYTANVDLAAGTIAQNSAPGGDWSGGSVGIRALRNGWFRVWSTVTVGAGLTNLNTNIILRKAGNNSYDGDGTSGLYIWGAQLEVGAFPSSYIPTTTAAVARAADVCSIPVTDFPFNPAEGTILVDAISAPGGTEQWAVTLSDGGSQNFMTLARRNTQAEFKVRSGNLDQVALNAGAWPTLTRWVLGAAYKADDFAYCANGGTVLTDTGGLVPAGMATLYVGSLNNGNQLYGHIRKLIYFPRRLSNAELQARTA